MVMGLVSAVLLQSASSYLIVDNLPIAKISGAKWAGVGEEKPGLPSKVLYEVGLTTAGKARSYDELVFQDGPGVWMVSMPGDDYGHGVFLCGRKPVRKRGIEKLGVKSAVYEGALKDYFKAAKLGHLKPAIKQILRVDLDGDGVKEVLIESSTRTSPPIGDTTVQDYSVILLRHVVKGKVKTEAIAKDVMTEPEGLMYLNTIRAVADLDGDGVMEVVASSDYYEGQSASVWRLKGGKLAKLAENGAGV